MICIHIDPPGEPQNSFTIVFSQSQGKPMQCVVRADFTHPDDEDRLGQTEQILTSTEIEALIEFLRGCL